MSKTVLILGAGRGQVPVMNLLHKYNCKVVAVSPKGNYPGLEIADSVIYENVQDKEKIYEHIKSMVIDAVVTDQLDSGVLSGAYIAEKIGIKGIGCETALKFTNKFIMRKEAKELGINVPENIIVSSLTDVEDKIKNLKFPLIMKPVDSAASRGIYKAESVNEIKDKFEDTIRYSKSGSVIVEEYITGQEYVVDAYTHNGKTHNMVVGHRDYFNIKDTFIPNATLFLDADSADSEVESRIKDINIKLVEGFGLNFGITHAEYLYNKEENKIYLVEIAARGGGVFISSDLIPVACGVNVNELLVKDVLGMEITDNEFKLKKGASAYFCYMVPKGEIVSIKNTGAVEKIKNVEKAFFDNVEVGMVTADIRDKASRKGPILVRGETKQQCYDTIEIAKKLLDIKIKTYSGVENVI